MKDSTLFVFYTLNKPERWRYGRFPKGWWWVGAGTTSAIGDKVLEYQLEEQFNGPKETIDKMIAYLDAYFMKLKAKNIVSIYKIRKTFSP